MRMQETTDAALTPTGRCVLRDKVGGAALAWHLLAMASGADRLLAGSGKQAEGGRKGAGADRNKEPIDRVNGK